MTGLQCGQVLCLTQGDGRSSQTLELEPATSRFLTLSCCFIDNLVARSQLALWSGRRPLACETALGWKSCFARLHPSHGRQYSPGPRACQAAVRSGAKPSRGARPALPRAQDGPVREDERQRPGSPIALRTGSAQLRQIHGILSEPILPAGCPLSRKQLAQTRTCTHTHTPVCIPTQEHTYTRVHTQRLS